MTPQPTILDALDAAEREATGRWEAVVSGAGWTLAMSRADVELAALARNHLRSLIEVARAAAHALPVSACDFPDGACEYECGRTESDHSGCLRIKALGALAPLLETHRDV